MSRIFGGVQEKFVRIVITLGQILQRVSFFLLIDVITFIIWYSIDYPVRQYDSLDSTQ